MCRETRTFCESRICWSRIEASAYGTYLPDLEHATLDLLLDGATGIWHLANQGETTWADFAREAARRTGLDPNAVQARPVHSLKWAAPRPLYSALGSERGHPLPPLESALDLPAS